jgi:alkylation response protein AidB-like acyl-CoA dehydrogenase
VDFGFTQEQKQLVARVSQVVRERIAPRAAGCDQSFEAPVEDIQDLHREGWLLANLAKRRGDSASASTATTPSHFS